MKYTEVKLRSGITLLQVLPGQVHASDIVFLVPFTGGIGEVEMRVQWRFIADDGIMPEEVHWAGYRAARRAITELTQGSDFDDFVNDHHHHIKHATEKVGIALAPLGVQLDSLEFTSSSDATIGPFQPRATLHATTIALADHPSAEPLYLHVGERGEFCLSATYHFYSRDGFRGEISEVQLFFRSEDNVATVAHRILSILHPTLDSSFRAVAARTTMLELLMDSQKLSLPGLLLAAQQGAANIDALFIDEVKLPEEHAAILTAILDRLRT